MFTRCETSQPRHDCFSWSGARQTLVSIFHATGGEFRQIVAGGDSITAPLKWKCVIFNNNKRKTGNRRDGEEKLSSSSSPPLFGMSPLLLLFLLNSLKHPEQDVSPSASAHPSCLCIKHARNETNVNKWKYISNKDTNSGSVSESENVKSCFGRAGSSGLNEETRASFLSSLIKPNKFVLLNMFSTFGHERWQI